ncbi:MAG: DUF2892 domain-containing protein [Bacteroidota bacterium]
MKKNMGKFDRLARIVIAAIIGVLYATHVISGTVAIILMVLALVFIATSLISFCPLYLPFGFRTNKDNNEKTI